MDTDIANVGSIVDGLLLERDLLHLILYRNKNQHRRSVWFKWLRMLKRDIEKLLVASGEVLPTMPKKQSSAAAHSNSSSARKGKLRKDGKQRKNTELREAKRNRGAASDPTEQVEGEYDAAECSKKVEHLKDVIIPGCHAAFTHVITDTQFSGMGMVLLAILARVDTLIRGESTEEQQRAGDLVQLQRIETHGMEIDEDHGEVISRDSIEAGSLGLVARARSNEVHITPPNMAQGGVEGGPSAGKKEYSKVCSPRSPKEAHATSTNAIDDLFDSLL